MNLRKEQVLAFEYIITIFNSPQGWITSIRKTDALLSDKTVIISSNPSIVNIEKLENHIIGTSDLSMKEYVEKLPCDDTQFMLFYSRDQFLQHFKTPKYNMILSVAPYPESKECNLFERSAVYIGSIIDYVKQILSDSIGKDNFTIVSTEHKSGRKPKVRIRIQFTINWYSLLFSMLDCFFVYTNLPKLPSKDPSETQTIRSLFLVISRIPPTSQIPTDDDRAIHVNRTDLQSSSGVVTSFRIRMLLEHKYGMIKSWSWHNAHMAWSTGTICFHSMNSAQNILHDAGLKIHTYLIEFFPYKKKNQNCFIVPPHDTIKFEAAKRTSEGISTHPSSDLLTKHRMHRKRKRGSKAYPLSVQSILEGSKVKFTGDMSTVEESSRSKTDPTATTSDSISKYSKEEARDAGKSESQDVQPSDQTIDEHWDAFHAKDDIMKFTGDMSTVEEASRSKTDPTATTSDSISKYSKEEARDAGKSESQDVQPSDQTIDEHWDAFHAKDDISEEEKEEGDKKESLESKQSAFSLDDEISYSYYDEEVESSSSSSVTLNTNCYLQCVVNEGMQLFDADEEVVESFVPSGGTLNPSEVHKEQISTLPEELNYLESSFMHMSEFVGVVFGALQGMTGCACANQEEDPLIDEPSVGEESDSKKL
ncbi:hypothetical protein ADUPG1_007746 [Aduncisulcus paluster]|uniref:Uncharacterized protein n=1 Tax=Aduncisulcus paluster TaxID=2918883 RepID=A0ABQ5KQW3_9EUKA|nr:hypothetical protein ADUPG1_007746 [Aduncisulcus paluster]